MKRGKPYKCLSILLPQILIEVARGIAMPLIRMVGERFFKSCSLDKIKSCVFYDDICALKSWSRLLNIIKAEIASFSRAEGVNPEELKLKSSTTNKR